MTKIEWQKCYGLEDIEMDTLTQLISIFNGRISSVNDMVVKSIPSSSDKLIKGIGYVQYKKIGNYKFNK